MKRISALTAAAVALVSTPAFAAPFTYAPEGCDFTITFPEKPFIEQKCTSGPDKKCVEVVSYTKVVSGDSSVDIRLTCDQLAAADRAAYTEEKLEELVRDMAKISNVEPSEISKETKGNVSTAAMVSVGLRGEREIFYTAQAWRGPASLFKLEASMLGPQNDKADQAFAAILRSAVPKADAAQAEKSKPAAKAETAKPEKPAAQ